jgi:alkanesulfonate monooxygenase SsuD/methylene tetrahydromethanopterin reductase-like flavin-dependent oxidoreductase (luciferase family)
VEAAADRLRGLFARFIGGMGPRGRNFHFNALARMGYEGAATRVRDLWLEGRTAEAAAAVPTAMIEAVALIGPPAKIREELPQWRGSLLTTLLVSVPPDLGGLRRVAELLLSA